MALGTFVLVDDSRETSGAAAGISPAGVHIPGLDVAQFQVMHSYWKPVDPQLTITGASGGQLGAVNVFFHNTIVSSSTSVCVIASDARSVELAFHRPGTDITHSLTLRELLPPHMKSTRITSTIPGWEPVPQMPRELAESVMTIRAMIRDLRDSRSIVRSEGLMRLAEGAAAASARGDDEPLEVWARRLADDVKDAND